MYGSFRHVCERLLKIPNDPEPPPGDETSTRIFRAAPNFYRYLLCVWAIRSLGILAIPTLALGIPLGAAAYVMLNKGQEWGWLLLVLIVLVVGIALLACLVSLAVIRLDFEKRWYLVTDRSLRVREGVVSVREMTVNFANIQNISISQGPLQRLLGLADLRVDTAGGGGGGGGHDGRGNLNLHTAWFRGISNAVEVRQLMQDRLKRLKDAGLGDPDDSSRRPVPEARPAVVEALREVLAEARLLRQAAESQR